MTRYLTWAHFASVSVCLAEFLNMLFWVTIHPETGECAFYKSSHFLSLRSFPPVTPLCRSAFGRLWGLAMSLVCDTVSRFSVSVTATLRSSGTGSEQPQIPRENRNSGDDQGICISAELCAVGVHVTIPKLILLA